MAWHLKVQQYEWFTVRNLEKFVQGDWVLKRVQYCEGEYKSSYHFARIVDANIE